MSILLTEIMVLDIVKSDSWTWLSHRSQIFGYKLFKISKTYEAAKRACEDVNATLANVGMRIGSVRE